MEYVKAKSISYGGHRNRDIVKAIAIHFTGNVGDTAEGNASFFHREGDGNTRHAGAHIFIDQKGNAVKSIGLDLIAWAVGDYEGTARGGAQMHGTFTNYNTVSIELCDIATKDPSPAMIKTVKSVIKYIRKRCPNAKYICRHFDISGKNCPGRMSGEGNARWKKFLEDIGEVENARPAVISVPWPTITLQKGATGSQVKKLQKCLNKLIKAGLAVDGSFGPATLKAVKKFQKKYKLAVDGSVGPKTRSMIKKKYKELLNKK